MEFQIDDPPPQPRTRAEKMAFIACIATLFAVPTAFTISYASEFYDPLRYFVLTQTGIVILVYMWTSGYIGLKLWRCCRTDKSSTLAQHLWGRVMRLFGCLVLLIEAWAGVYSRLGNEMLNYRTPVLQFVLIFLIMAWSFLDRHEIFLEEIPSEPQLGRILEELEQGKK